MCSLQLIAFTRSCLSALSTAIISSWLYIYLYYISLSQHPAMPHLHVSRATESFACFFFIKVDDFTLWVN